MYQKLPVYFLALLTAATLWSACTKATPFGADLLNDQIADYDFTDTITVRCTLEEEDSVLTSDRSSTASYFLCGELNDPVFGKSTSDLYALFQLSKSFSGFDPAKERFDSIVMYLGYDGAGVYGDTLNNQTLIVRRLSEQLRSDTDYYSTSRLLAGDELGRVDNFRPRPYTLDSLVSTTKGAFLRVKLNDTFGQELFGYDSLTYTTDANLWEKLKGIQISTSAGAASPGAMLAFDLNDYQFSFVRIYYTRNDTVHNNYLDYYFSGCNKFTHFDIDHSGTVIDGKIGQPLTDLMYIQGMSGLRLKVELPYIDQLQNIAVNQARLVLTTATGVPNDLTVLKPVAQTVMTETRGDSINIYTQDVLKSLGPNLNQGLDDFGGTPRNVQDNGATVSQYFLGLSYKLQDMIENSAATPKKKIFYVNVYRPDRSARRSILYGPQSATYPAKIELKYTRIQ